jgi:hypothetical protein
MNKDRFGDRVGCFGEKFAFHVIFILVKGKIFNQIYKKLLDF